MRLFYVIRFIFALIKCSSGEISTRGINFMNQTLITIFTAICRTTCSYSPMDRNEQNNEPLYEMTYMLGDNG